MTMINIENPDYNYDIPGTAILMAIIFGLSSLGLFVYFIHSISQSIQIGKVQEDIYKHTRKKIEEEISYFREIQAYSLPDTTDWYELKSRESGIFQILDVDKLVDILKENDLVVQCLKPLGAYFIEGIPVLRCNKPIDDEGEIAGRIFGSFKYYQEEHVEFNFHFGLKHITESAIKTLSPSINDPGSAIRALNYMVNLVVLRMKLPDVKPYFDDKGTLRLILNNISFYDTLYFCFRHIAVYGHVDVFILHKILDELKNMFYLGNNDVYKEAILDHVNIVREEAGKSIYIPADKEKLNQVIREMNQIIEKEGKIDKIDLL